MCIRDREKQRGFSFLLDIDKGTNEITFSELPGMNSYLQNIVVVNKQHRCEINCISISNYLLSLLLKEWNVFEKIVVCLEN